MFFLVSLAALKLVRATHEYNCLLQVKADVKVKHNKPDSMLLPAMEALLANSSKTFDGILNGTSLFEAALFKKQKAFRNQLSSLKRQYEQKLDLQGQEIVAVMASIVNVSGAINKTHTSNAVLRQQAAELQRSNLQLRGELEKLRAKLETAKAFTEQTLHQTNDTSSKALQVLNAPRPINRKEPFPDALSALNTSETVEKAVDYLVFGRHGREHHEEAESAIADNLVDDDYDVYADDMKQQMALLQVQVAAGATSNITPAGGVAGTSVGDKRTASNTYPETLHASQIQTSTAALLAAASAGLNDLEAEYSKSREYLQAMFLEHSEARSKKRSFWIAKREKAEVKLQSLLSLSSKLQIAGATLETTHQQLQQRIKGLKLYLARLAGTVGQ